MDERVRGAIGRALGADVARVAHVSGGDINEAHAVELSDGRSVFVKTNSSAHAAMFPAEAKGLAWLAEARALRIPEVLAVSRGGEGPAFLVLELLRPGRRQPDFDQVLGRGLAALHGCPPGGFGLDHDNFIGSLPQSNRAHGTWADFFREERLEAQLALPGARRLIGSGMRVRFERLFSRLDDLVGPAEPPARLHGDLWGGNLHGDEAGAPVLIDPAAYGGHREMDLAMMKLFGGFSGAVFAAYDEAYPLSPGHQERVPLYQLYPLLVHVNLFGGGYVGSVDQALSRYI